MKNLLIGAISGNYSINQIDVWVRTSNFKDCERVLFLYNKTSKDLELYLQSKGVTVVKPNFDFWGNEKHDYNYDTGKCDFATSYDLIHNIRFFHIWKYLQDGEWEKVMITDVRDVYFNFDPFSFLSDHELIATSEEVMYDQEEWNKAHIHYNLGLIGLETLLDKFVYNVGVFGGGADLVKQICADIYLMSVGKYKVADQTSFNYLIQTKYRDKVRFSDLRDKFAVHLHVVNAGLVKLDLNTINQFTVVHQYDRLKS